MSGQEKQDMVQVLEGLPEERLSALLHHPAFAEDVIECAGISRVLLKRVDKILERDVLQMPAGPREKFLKTLEEIESLTEPLIDR